MLKVGLPIIKMVNLTNFSQRFIDALFEFVKGFTMNLEIIEFRNKFANKNLGIEI